MNNPHSFSNVLVSELSYKHLLKHEFYKAWTEGTLSLDDLRVYARQYYHHVKAFPQYLSATHSNCSELRARQILLENLIDEERGEKNHPQLWRQFSKALGDQADDLEMENLFPETKRLISTFFDLSRSSYAEGLGALFAYEQQVPEVAASKIEGLQKYYGISEEEAIEFFTVHLKADIYHSQEVADLLNALPFDEKERARQAAVEAADALWGFLDGVVRETKCCA